jgi:hypothetical protein
MNTATPTMAVVTTPLMTFSAMFVQSNNLHPSTLVSFLMSVTGVSAVDALCSSRIRSPQAWHGCHPTLFVLVRAVGAEREKF